MVDPSGDQSGWAMAYRSRVSLRAVPPEAEQTHRTPSRSRASRRPSGEGATAKSVPEATDALPAFPAALAGEAGASTAARAALPPARTARRDGPDNDPETEVDAPGGSGEGESG